MTRRFKFDKFCCRQSVLTHSGDTVGGGAWRGQQDLALQPFRDGKDGRDHAEVATSERGREKTRSTSFVVINSSIKRLAKKLYFCSIHEILKVTHQSLPLSLHHSQSRGSENASLRFIDRSPYLLSKMAMLIWTKGIEIWRERSVTQVQGLHRD